MRDSILIFVCFADGITDGIANCRFGLELCCSANGRSEKGGVSMLVYKEERVYNERENVSRVSKMRFVMIKISIFGDWNDFKNAFFLENR